MNQETPTLSIQDIVLLKERPQDYLKLHNERLTKTHDGTSGGPIKDHLRIMVGQYSQDAYAHTMVLSSDGKTIDEYHGITGTTTPVGDTQQYIRTDGTDMHIITKLGQDTDTNGYHFTEGTLNKNELKELMLQDDEGNYKVRSMTLVGHDGSSMTAVRDNTFNPENHEKYEQLCEEFTPKIQEWAKENRGKPYAEAVQNLTNDFIKEHGREPTYNEKWGEGGIYDQAKNIYDDIPTVEEYITNELSPEFEEIGVKIKYQKNNHIPYEGQDYDSSYERWREDLYALGPEDGGELWYTYFGD